jgi:hypothetical protein
MKVMPLLKEPNKAESPVPKPIRELLDRMHELAMLLRKRRFAAGALELTIGEVKLDFDEEGKVKGAHEVEHDESHQIIEEFMLAANIAVATKFADRGMLFLRRGHGEPDFVKLKAFAEFAGALGYPIQQFQSRLALQALLDEAHGQPNERAVNCTTPEHEAGQYHRMTRAIMLWLSRTIVTSRAPFAATLTSRSTASLRKLSLRRRSRRECRRAKSKSSRSTVPKRSAVRHAPSAS